ncbi:phosphatase PAP2 family protein [Novosphingobium sp. YJ-S2-02]|uniref:Acid phosphatase n=1 Tax=Novosphingobium aureum TaxID=2792964 RepID=A0A931HB22_9SPHN|nr:phosphatase PAP2 family protein [Novosphingobium aureum]MBH0112243.1 phosphatase PAP2 family protein [Novosphingobium aureum]
MAAGVRARLLSAQVAALALLASGCATTSETSPAPPTSVEAVGLLSPELPWPRGFLAATALPDSLALLPAPPAAGSAEKAADEAAFEQSLGASAQRWALASSDADLEWPHVVASFEPLVATKLSDAAHPHTAMLLRRAMADAAMATYAAKNRYQRVRPFVEHESETCTPGDEAALRSDGSYPSGHTAIGWMLALVLTDLVPQRQDVILQRGYDFGYSRVICRVHWMSDTRAGRVIAAATFARLQADPVYQAQRDLARSEIAAAR